MKLINIIRTVILILLSLGALASLISICTSLDNYHTILSCFMFMLFSSLASAILLLTDTSEA